MPDEPRTGRSLIGLALLLGAVALVFAPGIGPEFTWDDNGLIRTNRYVQDPALWGEALTSHFWHISADDVETNVVYQRLYRPVVTLALIVQYRLFGQDASGYRVVSLLLHLACVSLVVLWLRRRIPGADDPARLAPIALAAGLFAVHPSRVEVVSWIAGSTELWWSLFLLGAATALDRGRAALAGALLGLACLSKETAFLAGPLLILDRWLRDEPVGRRHALAVGLPVVLALSLRTAVVGLGAGPAELGAASRVLASWGLYALQIVAPLNPTIFPGTPEARCGEGVILDPSWIAAGCALVLGSLVVAMVARRREAWRPPLADLLWLLVPLLPVVNLIDLHTRSLTADRFLYVPLLGVAGLLARLLTRLLETRRTFAIFLALTATLMVAGFGVVTRLHTQVFASSSTLWEYELERSPRNPDVLHSVGTARVRAGLGASGTELIVRMHQEARDSCIHRDLVQATVDLAWALTWTASADDHERLAALERAYAGLTRGRHLHIAATRGWTVELTANEHASLIASARRYHYPYALVLARRGRLAEARARLSQIREPLAEARELRIRLRAADGARDAARAEAERAGLHELALALRALDQLQEAPPPRLVAYALGLGPAQPLDSLGVERDRRILAALRAVHAFGELPPARDPRALRELVSAHRRRRDLDAQLVAAPR